MTSLKVSLVGGDKTCSGELLGGDRGILLRQLGHTSGILEAPWGKSRERMGVPNQVAFTAARMSVHEVQHARMRV